MTLINISAATGETKYLAPIPRTVDYLQRSKLAGDRLARFYELQTNRPLYMKRRGDLYQLTYDDSRLPSHYGWKIASRLDEIGRAFRRVQRGEALRPAVVPAELQDEVTRIVRSLDEQGRWIDTYSGQRLVGQPKFREAERYISSATFSRNMELLADYLQK
jgi:hypothetical protein